MKTKLNNIRKAVFNNVGALVIIATVTLCAAFIIAGTRSDDGSITLDGSNAKYSESQEDALCELASSRDDAIAGLLGIDTPQDASSGCDPTDLAQMGASVYYGVDVSTPTAFYNAVNGKGFNEGYGMQCVAGFKEFMFALSGKYVATKTGGASGYAQQQSQIEPLGFTWHSGTSGLQDGDWAIFGGGKYGHVAMYYQGKWFGQNQGASNSSVGNAFNLLSISDRYVIGYYRPNIYKKTTVTPTTPTTPSTDSSTGSSSGSSSGATSYVVVKGDTLGGIALKNGWYSGVRGLFGDSGYAQALADKNGIVNRGLIYPGAVITKE